MAEFVTTEDAQDHLRILAPDENRDLERKLNQAEELVLAYVEIVDTGWTIDTVPERIKAAILMVAAHLWDHRGEENEGDPLSPAVRSVLKMLREPVLA